MGDYSSQEAMGGSDFDSVCGDFSDFGSSRDTGWELARVQQELYQAEKRLSIAMASLDTEVARKKAEIKILEAKVSEILRRELSILRNRRPLKSGILLNAVWEDGSDEALRNSKQVHEEEVLEKEVQEKEVQEEEEVVRQSTLEVGGEMVEAAPAFSQALSDVVENIDVLDAAPDVLERKKVTRFAAWALRKENEKVAAEDMLKDVLEVDVCDLTTEDVEEFKRAVEIVRKKLNRLKAEVARRKLKVDRPDETFLSSSFFQDLQDKAKEIKAEQVDQETTKNTDEMKDIEAVMKDTFEEGERGFFKAFTDLKPHSNAMKTRSDQILTSLRQWCEENKCELLRGVGYMLHRHYYVTDKRIASMGWDLYTMGKGVVRVREVPTSTALWLMERLYLGRGRYTEVRHLLLR